MAELWNIRITMESWLNGDDALDSIDELLMNGHAVFNGEAPRPLRIQEELVPPSQYSDGSDVEDDGPRQPKLHHIQEMLRKVDKVASDDHPLNPENFKTEDFAVYLTKTNLNPQVPEFVPIAKQSGENTTDKADVELVKIEGSKGVDLKSDVPKTEITQQLYKPPRQRNMALISIKKMNALHGKASGDTPTVQLLRPEDFLTPVETVSELLAPPPEPSAAPAAGSAAILDARDEPLGSDEKVARWLDDDKPKVESPKPAPEVSLSKQLVFVPKVSPAGSGPGSPARASPAPAAHPPPPAAAPSPRPTPKGPTPFVATAKADAFYEKYNRSKKLKEFAKPTGILESHLENTVWAAVSRELTEKELKKQAMTDAA